MADRLLSGRKVRGPESARIWIDDEPYVNFVGCSYLALQSMDDLRSAAKRALDLGHPWSQMSSSAYGGSDPVFEEISTEGARYFGRETSVFMPTGYFCGLAAVAGLQGSFDLILIDELAHFSLLDAARLATCPVFTFAHADANALQDLVRKECKGKRPLLLTDGVFATSGRVPPLTDYAAMLVPVGGQLFIDESHAYGVVGPSGQGAAEHCDVTTAHHAGTLGKGLCAQGALLPCSIAFAARVRALPPLRGAGSGSPVSALVGAAALRLARQQPQRRERLHQVSQRLKTGLRGLGLDIVRTPAPITAFRTGSRSQMEAMQRSLLAVGLHLVISDYIGAGPEGVFRCATFADHSEDDIDRLLSSLRERL